MSVPLAGLLLCLGVRRKGLAIFLLVLFLLGSAHATLVGVDAYRTREPEPVDQGPRVCQESSGVDNRCPGG